MPRSTLAFDAFVEANPGLAHDADVFGIAFDEDTDVKELAAAIEVEREVRAPDTCQRCGSYVKGRKDLNRHRYCPACDDAVASGKTNADGDRVSDGNPEYVAARDAADLEG